VIRRGLNEAIAHVKGEEEAGGIRIFVPDETPAKTCAPIEADLKELDCEVYAGRAIAHQCLRLSEAIFIEAPALSHSRSIRSLLGAIQLYCS